ncbi:diacylglycerol kinase [Pseudoflavitalea sp. G-6-1-2]|uniref:diacylglycerol/lipid kinase family protein n=1 Tax=Pseudoflavitalea sp. G-6-1-2 TaxID=2728841 RepID=UPI00146C74EE|nr:diacylglycerol kinase family protein [Pseudoflavitalea sp. G-6-1-2]NML20061.1 diacylglycerol kinase [Pseudoflavitalea sp. G-6-1-2]
MQTALIIHNPGAGDQEHSKQGLLQLMQSQGYDCRYFSTKKDGWEKLDADADLIVVVGGDGTVGKVIDALIHQKLHQKIPLALLPAGTANNIASALGITGDPEEIVAAWQPGLIKKFDVGLFHHKEQDSIFLEGAGFGLFPKLLIEMKKLDDKQQSADESLQTALQTLHSIVTTAKSRYCKLELDGEDHSGDYLLLEIMNTRTIGPNLVLAPQADPGDGHFDAVWIREDERNKLLEYLQHRLNREDAHPPFHSVSCRRIHLEWAGAQWHLDSALEKLQKPPVTASIELVPEMLQFLLPAKASVI